MFTVTRRTQVPSPPARTWECLTRPALISKWFADTELFEEGSEFRFEFGDGDFFVGRVEQWREPSLLALCWRLMGLGPAYQVTYFLTPTDKGCTALTVTDSGAVSADEARSLAEGWDDFLKRLADYAATGERTRFTWSEVVSFGAIFGTLREGLPAELGEEDWWQAAFTGANVRRAGAPDDDTLVAEFGDRSWEGCTTKAELVASRLASGVHVSVTHGGWDGLSEGRRLFERKRYAGLWAKALQPLEQRYC